jgi:acyl-CoA reductase-like NAD-dependent aldehyde dehydrogenase
MIELKDPSLWKHEGFVAGAWTPGGSGQTTEILNPANRKSLGVVPNMGAAEARRAIEAAHAALPAWSKKTAGERAKIMRRWFDLMMSNQDDLAVIMTAEQGKPLAESKGEIAYAAAFIEWFAEEGKRVYGDIIPGHQADKRLMVLRSPVGVVAAITPWNFPAAMITRKAAPALAAGCTIVIKPAPQTPFSVLDDADLDAAVAGAIASKYRNTGQTCVCANRFIVQDKVYDAFAQKLVEAVKKLRVGDGLEGETDQGPLIDQKALEKVEKHVADAKAKGAQVAIGGKRHALAGTFYEPTVLTNVSTDMMLAREETFGPVSPLFRVKTDEEAIRLANDTEFGLAAYLYTRDLARSWRVTEALEYGIVGLNTGLISTEVAPFGGVKESGIGREGSRYGILEFTELKYVCVGGI